MYQNYRVSYRNGAVRRHRLEPWSSEHVSTRFVMERSHGYIVPQLSVGLNLLIHTMLSIGENQNSLLCTNAGEGNLHYCCGSEQQWAGFCCITAFYHATGRAFQNWCPLLRVEKKKKTETKGHWEQTAETSSSRPSLTLLLPNPPWEMSFTWLQLQREHLMPSYHMYLNDLNFYIGFFLTEIRLRTRGFSFKGKGRWLNAS